MIRIEEMSVLLGMRSITISNQRDVRKTLSTAIMQELQLVRRASPRRGEGEEGKKKGAPARVLGPSARARPRAKAVLDQIRRGGKGAHCSPCGLAKLPGWAETSLAPPRIDFSRRPSRVEATTITGASRHECAGHCGRLTTCRQAAISRRTYRLLVAPSGIAGRTHALCARRDRSGGAHRGRRRGHSRRHPSAGRARLQ